MSSAPPKTIWFAFEYKEYFKKLEDEDVEDYRISFTTRTVFSQILWEEFEIGDIFDYKSNDIESNLSSINGKASLYDYTCRLFSIVGYYGFHYMSFVKHNKEWYLWEDAKNKYIGNLDKLFEYLERWKIIPYLVFYNTFSKFSEEQSHQSIISYNSQSSEKIKYQSFNYEVKVDNILGIQNKQILSP